MQVPVKQKVVAYITRERHGRTELLVFDHVHSPEAGTQVPAGTIDPGEHPRDAVLREVFEESGLADVTISSCCGCFDFFSEPRQELHKRHLFLLTAAEPVADEWVHTVSSGTEDEGMAFAYFWIDAEAARTTLSGHQGDYLALARSLADGETSLPAEDFLAALPGARVEELRKENETARAWFVNAEGGRLFAKWAPAATFDSTLAKDVAICMTPPHPAIVPVLHVITTADGVLLIFPRVEGEPLTTPAARARFFALPLGAKLEALRTIFGALAAVVDGEWIMEDFYEGNVIHDANSGRTYLFDFELFHQGGSYVLDRDRAYGSSRLLAPEERVRGSVIDQRSNVYTLGRYAICALSSRIDEAWREGFQGSSALAKVLATATAPERGARYESVREFVAAFEASARG